MKRQRINSHARERYAKRNQERIGVGRGRKPKRSNKNIYTLQTLFNELLPPPISEQDSLPQHTEDQRPSASDTTALLYTSYANKKRSKYTLVSERTIIDRAAKLKSLPRARRFITDIDTLYYHNIKQNDDHSDHYLFSLLLHCNPLYPYFIRQFHEDYWKKTYNYKCYSIDSFAMGHWQNAILQYETYLANQKPDLHRKAWEGIDGCAELLNKNRYRAKKQEKPQWITGLMITKNQCLRAEKSIELRAYTEESVAFYHALIRYLRSVRGIR